MKRIIYKTIKLLFNLIGITWIVVILLINVYYYYNILEYDYVVIYDPLKMNQYIWFIGTIWAILSLIWLILDNIINKLKVSRLIR